MKEEFIVDIEKQIAGSRRWHKIYMSVHIFLTLLIAIFGFLTAAAANADLNEEGLIFSSASLMFYGLASAASAVLIQVVNPQEKALYHRANKHLLRSIMDEVKFDVISVQEGQLKRSKLREQTAVSLAVPKK